MSIKSILEAKGPELISVSSGDAVRKVTEVFKREQIGFALVVNTAHTTVGSVSERDIVQAIAEHGEVGALPVTAIMTTNVVRCSSGATIDHVRELMTSQRTRHVVVMDGDRAVGVVSIGDIIKHSLDACQRSEEHTSELQ
mgnify:CR=1 FL=1